MMDDTYPTPRRGYGRSVFDNGELFQRDSVPPRRKRRPYKDDDDSLFDDSLYDTVD